MEIPRQTRVAMVLNIVAEELSRACKLHNGMNSAHEAYSVILEELDEFWEEVRKKREYRSAETMKKELVQIAAMACRAIVDLKLESFPELQPEIPLDVLRQHG